MTGSGVDLSGDILSFGTVSPSFVTVTDDSGDYVVTRNGSSVTGTITRVQCLLLWLRVSPGVFDDSPHRSDRDHDSLFLPLRRFPSPPLLPVSPFFFPPAPFL